MSGMMLNVFKSAVKQGEPPGAGTVLHKQMATVFEAGDERRVKFTVSTGSVDRDGDTVALGGWVLDAYMANPVVLWGHQSTQLPIGKCVSIGIEDGALKALVEFVPADMPEIGSMAEAVLRMCKTGFLSATSVGFRPLEYELAKERDDGEGWFPPIDFVRQELMEFSVVGIPANSEALIDPAYRRAPGAAAVAVASATETPVKPISQQRRLSRMRAYA